MYKFTLLTKFTNGRNMQNMAQMMSIKETRDKLADVINQVAVSGDTIVVTKFGRPKAMIVPVTTTQTTKSVLEETSGIWKSRKDIKSSAQWTVSLRAKMSARE